jgi:hypothetical protein
MAPFIGPPTPGKGTMENDAPTPMADCWKKRARIREMARACFPDNEVLA